VLGDGSVIVADTGERTLLKLSPSGRPLGTYRAPLGGSRFVRPEALAAAPDGTFYLADPGAEAIDHLSEGGRLLASRHVPAIAQGREDGAGSPFPTGLAVGREGNLFVADGGLDRIEVRSPSGALLAVFGSEGSGAGQLSAPAGLAIDCQGNLLVADAGNNRIAVFIGAARPGCPPAAAADL
jgi:tripartite motif-containing protein 71